MAGIDGYTKLMLHCNGTDGSTSFPDDSASSHTVTANRDAQVDTAQKKFGTGSGLFDKSASDYLSMDNHSDFAFGTGDFTIDFWVRFNSFPLVQTFFGFDTASGNFNFIFYNSQFRIYWNGGWLLIGDVLSLSIDTWYHVAFVRNGNNWRVYVDGVEKGETTNSLFIGTPNSVYGIVIGAWDSPFYLNGFLDGHIDEFRVSKGIARWTSDFTPPTEEYSSVEEETLNINEDAVISQSLEKIEAEESLLISEDAVFHYTEIIEEESLLIGEYAVFQNFAEIIEEETLNISEDSDIHSVGDIDVIFNTDLRTLVIKSFKYATNLITTLFSFKKYNTKLNTKVDSKNIFSTDLRVRYNDYDSINVGTLNDFIVKLDGTELTDVDYSTLKVIYNLNSTPSSATCILARRHDKLDYKLDDTYSQITNENKIEVYDGTDKFFTGYVTQIAALSSTDTVQITAQDARYKISRTSLDIWYGGKYKGKDEVNGNVNSRSQLPTTNNNYGDIYKVANSYYWWPLESSSGGWQNWTPLREEYLLFEKTIGTAIQEVISAISSLISGYDGVPFATSFVPEYAKVYNDCASLLNAIITQTANANWYLDENERLKYQKLESGTIKTLPLSSLNKHRHAYDVILSDVTLNKQNSAYAKSLSIKLGKHIIRFWSRRYFSGWDRDSGWSDFCNNLIEKISFGFQQWGKTGKKWYTGILGTIYSYADSNGWVLKATIVVQYQTKDSEANLDDVIIGSGSPTKTIYLTSYGKKEANIRWEERIKPSFGYSGGFATPASNEVPYLTYVQEETYDHTNFAQDIANFELNQNNKLQTNANITLLLDAYKYYSLNMSDRINLSNTLNSTIYKNNNGFPLNINSIKIDCNTRIVTLSLTNLGKSWYVKTANYLGNYTPSSVNYVMKKEPVVRYSGS